MKKALAGLCLLVGSMGVQAAGGLDLALSNNTANLAVLLNPHQLYQGGGSELSVGGFVSEDGDRLGHVTLMARDTRLRTNARMNTSSYSLGAGIKAIAGDVFIPASINGEETNESVGAIALGLQLGWIFPSAYNPVELSFEGFIAPSITSFSDAERYSEVGVRLQIDVIPQAKAYVGYRRMRFDTNDFDNVRLDRSVHLGLKLTF